MVLPRAPRFEVREHPFDTGVALSAVAAIVTLVVAVADLTTLNNLLHAISPIASVSVAWGLWLLVASATGLAASAIALIVSTASGQGITRKALRAEFRAMSSSDRRCAWSALGSCVLTIGLLGFLVYHVSGAS
ncbi:hypothetical protein [Rhodococcus sp. ACT016]|uniref:hypothetical protein n=1 Tax=Rhodococcus sp. ACT016 TaxID=3134808 RepID=UPI003D265F17